MTKASYDSKGRRKLDYSGRLKNRKKKQTTAFSESKRKLIRSGIIDILRKVNHPHPGLGNPRKREMAKRKRTYKRYPRRYKRRYMPSTASLIRRMAKAQAGIGPVGDPTSAQFKMYGPSLRQIQENPGWSRSADQSAARVRDNYRGDGDYITDAISTAQQWLKPRGWFSPNAALGAMFRNAGQAAGGWIGAPDAGRAAGAAVSKWLGSGDYVPNSRLVSGQVQSSVVHNGMEFFEVSHRELVENVYASADGRFVQKQYDMTPSSKTFQWMNNISKNFEMYRLTGCMFQYIPLYSDDGGTSKNLGKIVMVHDEDVLKKDFANTYQMENTKGAVSTNPSRGLVLGVECAADRGPNGNLYFMPEKGESADVRDPLFQSNGNFFVATEGVSSTGPSQEWQSVADSQRYKPQFDNPGTIGGTNRAVLIGELWVTYTCVFAKPKIPRPEENCLNAGLALRDDVPEASGVYPVIYTHGASSVRAELHRETSGSTIKRLYYTITVPPKEKHTILISANVDGNSRWDGNNLSLEAVTTAAAGVALTYNHYVKSQTGKFVYSAVLNGTTHTATGGTLGQVYMSITVANSSNTDYKFFVYHGVVPDTAAQPTNDFTSIEQMLDIRKLYFQAVAAEDFDPTSAFQSSTFDLNQSLISRLGALEVLSNTLESRALLRDTAETLQEARLAAVEALAHEEDHVHPGHNHSEDDELLPATPPPP